MYAMEYNGYYVLRRQICMIFYCQGQSQDIFGRKVVDGMEKRYTQSDHPFDFVKVHYLNIFPRGRIKECPEFFEYIGVWVSCKRL
jgi:hypothetical protein